MNTKLRHISYCIMASLLFVACRQESHPITPEEPEEQYAISLSASSSAMTNSRAIVDSEATLQATTLGVFAYKQLADGTKVSVFDNTKVSYDDNEGWTYTGTKYWDRTAHYYFVSYSPHLEDEDVEYYYDQLYIKNIPSWQTIDADAKDYLIADDHGAADGYYITSNGPQAVPLKFTHILCQLEVRVAKNAFLSSTYTLSGISYINVPPKDTKVSFMHTPNGGLVRSSIFSEAQTMATPDNVEVTDGTTEGTIQKHLVVPFYVGDGDEDKFKIKLNYAVNGSSKEATVNTGLNQLEKNKRYVLTLTFNSGADIKTSLEILDWEDEEVEEPKYNW